MSALALHWACVPDEEEIPGPNKDVASWARKVYKRTSVGKDGRRLNQEDWAEQIGASRNGLNKVLNGWTRMNSDTRKKLVAAAPWDLKAGPEAIVLLSGDSVETRTRQAYEGSSEAVAGGSVETRQAFLVGQELDKIADDSERTDAMIRAIKAIRENPSALAAEKRPDRPQRKP